jgi:exosortase J
MEALSRHDSGKQTLAAPGISAPRFPALPQEQWRRLLPCFLIALLGLLALSPALAQLWVSWTTDALRSIGMFFPIISVALTLHVWRRLGWETHGTWWGLLPLFYAVAATHTEGNTHVRFVLTSHVDFSLIPRGLTVFAYASGITLIFGGVRVWRQAAFPLSLLLFVNPAPQFFNAVVDLPLQYLSARATRAFAMMIGVHPNGEQLRLMFAPQFGMFIAPGCNGIRGGLTMAYLGLILGYIYKFSIRLRMFTVVCALALGYLFNLVRLCVLVLYYWLALHVHPLQAHAEAADYLIGVVLFVLATVLFFSLIRRNEKKGGEFSTVETGEPIPDSMRNSGNVKLGWKCLVSLALLVVAASPYIYSDGVRALTGSAHEGATTNFAPIFPTRIGKWTLLKTWQERDAQQKLMYSWGTYSSDDQAGEVEVGVWSPSGVHYPIACHLARGEKPVWSAVRILPLADGKGTFQMTSYQNEGANLVEASTICTTDGCYESGSAPFRKGLSFRSAGIRKFVFSSLSGSRPLIIRKQSPGTDSSFPKEAPQTIGELQGFISKLTQSEIRRFLEVQNR